MLNTALHASCYTPGGCYSLAPGLQFISLEQLGLQDGFECLTRCFPAAMRRALVATAMDYSHGIKLRRGSRPGTPLPPPT